MIYFSSLYVTALPNNQSAKTWSRSVEMQEPIFQEPGGQKAGEQDPGRAGQFLKSSLLRVFSFLSLLPF